MTGVRRLCIPRERGGYKLGRKLGHYTVWGFEVGYWGYHTYLLYLPLSLPSSNSPYVIGARQRVGWG